MKGEIMSEILRNQNVLVFLENATTQQKSKLVFLSKNNKVCVSF